MRQHATIRISVPEDAEEPLTLITDALERYCGTTYPIWRAPLDDDEAYRNHEGAIVLEKEDLS